MRGAKKIMGYVNFGGDVIMGRAIYRRRKRRNTIYRYKICIYKILELCCVT